MQITSPVLRSLSLLVALCLCAGPLDAQISTLPIQFSQGQPQSADTPNLPTTTERIAGVVVSSVDGAPIPRALVTSTDQRFAAFTDSQGRFSCDLRRTAPAGSGQTFPIAPTPSNIFIAFAVRKPGFVNATLSFALPAVQPDSPEPPLTLKLVPTGVITGHVYPESGDLPESLNIQLLRKQVSNGRATWFPANNARPDSRGEFRLANLDPGEYKLFIPARITDNDSSTAPAAAHAGILPVYYSNAATEDAATVIQVGAGTSVALDLRLHAGRFYDVTIPLAGPPAKVPLRVIPLNAPPGLNVQQSGQSFVDHLPDGTYDLLLYSMEPGSPNDPNPKISDALVKVEVHGKAVRTPPVSLHPIPDIPIVIRREFTSGQPQPATPPNQPSVLLFLQNLRQDLGQPAPNLKPNTGDEGLALVGATPGVYTVGVLARLGGAAYVASATSGTTDLLHEPFQVLANSDPRPIEITLRDDFASIDASIIVDPAMPPASTALPAMLFCIPLDRPQAMPGFAAAQQNQASVQNLAPGRYLLLAGFGAQRFSSLEYTNPDVLKGLMQKGTVVTLAPNEKATVQVPLLPEGDN
jgi:hypothetical protein